MKNKNYHLGYVTFLALVAAGGGFLFGYDTAVISGTIGQVTQLYHLDVLQQGWYVGSALIGSIVGVAFAGTLSDRLGRKPAMIVSAAMFTLSALGCALCATFDQLVVYRIIGGVGIGVASIVCPMYISEIAVTQFRGRLVSTYQLAITVGFVAAYLANFLLLQWSRGVGEGSGLWHKVMVDEVYRGMLGMETVPALLFFIVIFMLPESPRWLILKGQDRRAKSIFSLIYRREADAEHQVAEVADTMRREEKSEVRYLFRPGIRTALVAGVCIAVLGQFMGVNAVLYYGPKIFEDAGLSSGDSLFYQVLVGMVNMLTTVLALCIIDKVGRKQLVYYGVSGMIVSLLLIATYFSFGEAWHWSSVVMLVFFLLYVFFTAVSICAVVWVLLSEMYPTRVRGLAMSIAGFALWIATYLVSQLTPWLLSAATPSGTFIIFAVMCLPYLFIMWRYIPETTGRSLEDIERYWLKDKR